jgi:ClpP class serine protease
MEFFSKIFSTDSSGLLVDDNHIKIIDQNMYPFGKLTYDTFMDAYGQINQKKPLIVTLKTKGGDVKTFLPIARIIANHPEKTTLFVNRYAYSGGTLLCLMK